MFRPYEFFCVIRPDCFALPVPHPPGPSLASQAGVRHGESGWRIRQGQGGEVESEARTELGKERERERERGRGREREKEGGRHVLDSVRSVRGSAGV